MDNLVDVAFAAGGAAVGAVLVKLIDKMFVGAEKRDDEEIEFRRDALTEAKTLRAELNRTREELEAYSRTNYALQTKLIEAERKYNELMAQKEVLQREYEGIRTNFESLKVEMKIVSGILRRLNIKLPDENGK